MKSYLLLLLASGGLLFLTACKEHDDLVPELEGVPAGGVTNAQVPTINGDEAELEVWLFAVDHLGGFIRGLDTDNFSIETTNVSEMNIESVTQEDQESRGPFSASLLFDQSGSINSTDPQDARIEAGINFADLVKGGDEAAVAAFSASGAYTYPYELLADFSRDADPLKDAIHSLAGNATGGTPLYQAMYDLIPYIAENGRNENLALIAFTDGADTEGGVWIDDLIQRAQDNNVGIYTVGLGSGVDQNILTKVAFETEGAVMLAEDALQLIALYSSLGDLLHGEAELYRLKIKAKKSWSNFRSGDVITATILLELSQSSVIRYPFRAFVF